MDLIFSIILMILGMFIVFIFYEYVYVLVVDKLGDKILRF